MRARVRQANEYAHRAVRGSPLVLALVLVLVLVLVVCPPRLGAASAAGSESALRLQRRQFPSRRCWA